MGGETRCGDGLTRTGEEVRLTVCHYGGESDHEGQVVRLVMWQLWD